MAVKSSLGDSLGASGAMQVVLLIEAMKQSLSPGIQTMSKADPDFSMLENNIQNRPVEIRYALANAVSADGNCCAVVLKNISDE
jgi:3-oxoacyl-(acyl-carrier-protein) synthase